MIFCAHHFERGITIQVCGYFFKPHAKQIFFELIFYSADSTIKNLFPFVYKNDMIADLFYLFHAMRTKEYCRTPLRQLEDLIFDQVAVYRIQATEWLIKDDKFWFMQDSGNKLQFLAHSF